jgi:glycosyltransferase involved in cell wall biosynthesis
MNFSPEDFVVGTLANLTPQKGLEDFVLAAAVIAVRVSRSRFVIYGSRMESQLPYERKIRRLIDSFDILRGRMSIVPPGDKIPSCLNTLDVFVATSVPRSEGVPTALLEAMSAGRSAVTTDVGGIRDAVRNGVTGFLVPSGDLTELVDAVVRLRDNPLIRNETGLKARDEARKRFDARICADVHIEAYGAAMARRSD